MIILGLKTPGIANLIGAGFLQSEWKTQTSHKKSLPKQLLKIPMKAGIPTYSDLIDKVADEVVNYERNCVSGISALLGALRRGSNGRNYSSNMIQY